MKAYKIIAYLSGKRYSFNTDYFKLDKDINLEYSTEFTTVPTIPNSKLFVFETAESATNFVNIREGRFELWEVEVDVLETPTKNLPLFSTDIKEYWTNGSEEFCLMTYPAGTKFANSVRLVRQIP